MREEHTPWKLSKRCLERRVLPNSQIHKRNVLFTTLFSAKQTSSWVKSRVSVTAPHGSSMAKRQICGLDKDACIKEQSSKDDCCLVPCTGIYVDITEELFLQELRRQHSNSSRVKDEDKKQELLNFQYIRCKRNYVKQLWFDPNELENLSRFFFFSFFLKLCLCSTSTGWRGNSGARLHTLWHRDLWWAWKRCQGVKLSSWSSFASVFLRTLQVTTEAALGLVGGTMGLLTGFSILSGVEIIYNMIRFNLCVCLPFVLYLSTLSQVLHVFKGSPCWQSLCWQKMIWWMSIGAQCFNANFKYFMSQPWRWNCW